MKFTIDSMKTFRREDWLHLAFGELLELTKGKKGEYLKQSEKNIKMGRKMGE